jgi:hypothetical protein
MSVDKHSTSQKPKEESYDNAKRVLPPVEARQGVTGHNVRYVLWISSALAVIGVALAFAWS